MIRVLLVEDPWVERDGLRTALESDREVQVVGCAGNGREAFELCGRLAPDVVLMDMIMPGCDGIQGTRLIKTKYKSVKVLIVTGLGCYQYVSAALSNGADGFILGEAASEELLSAIKGVNHSFGLIHKKTYDQMIAQFRGQSVKPKSPGFIPPDTSLPHIAMIPDNPAFTDNPVGKLADREKEIIRYIVEGKNNREISQVLYLSEGRVKNLITGILKKLGVKGRTQLVVYALKKKLV